MTDNNTEDILMAKAERMTAKGARRLHAKPHAPATAGSIRPAIGELERAYAALLPRFVGAMELAASEAARQAPAILIQRRGRRERTLGWMSPRAWERASDGSAFTHNEPSADPGPRFNEITVTAESLARGARAAFEVMSHEMVHHVNTICGRRDCSASQYHNKLFKGLAEAVGLVVGPRGAHGWSATSLGPELEALAASLALDERAFSVFRVPPPPRKAGSRMRKWVCPACTQIIRAASDELEVLCVPCNQPFEQTAG